MRVRDKEVPTVKWRRVEEALRSELAATRHARPDRTASRLRRLARATGLTRTDTAILELLLRHLADRLGLEVLQKRASELMSMWVGGTEKQVAEAFAEARDAEAFLVFDEADSLLADRRLAQRPRTTTAR